MFLEWFIEKLIGPPARRSHDRSWWRCPLGTHEDATPSFCTLPHDPARFPKDRWICHGCQDRGDEADLLKRLAPWEPWSVREKRIENLRMEYEYTISKNGTPTPTTPTPSTTGSNQTIRGGGPKQYEPITFGMSVLLSAMIGARPTSPLTFAEGKLLVGKAGDRVIVRASDLRWLFEQARAGRLGELLRDQRELVELINGAA